MSPNLTETRSSFVVNMQLRCFFSLSSGRLGSRWRTDVDSSRGVRSRRCGAEELREHERPPIYTRLVECCVRENERQLLRERKVVGPLGGFVCHEREGDVVVKHAGPCD